MSERAHELIWRAQRLMTRVLGDLEGCIVYLDDVVVCSDTWSSHVERIRALFMRLAEARLTINLAKCEFAQATVTYLGQIVGQGKVRPTTEKERAVQCYPPPTTKKELMRFLGLVGYYRGFCRNFSEVVAPLTDLLKTRVIFVWSFSCQQAFEVVVYTNHNPLIFLNSLQCPNQWLVRWLLFLQSHWLDIRHIKGSENVVANALSRALQG